MWSRVVWEDEDVQISIYTLVYDVTDCCRLVCVDCCRLVCVDCCGVEWCGTDWSGQNGVEQSSLGSRCGVSWWIGVEKIGQHKQSGVEKITVVEWCGVEWFSVEQSGYIVVFQILCYYS